MHSHGYSVQWRLVVDHPEKRDSSFRPVPPGSFGQRRDFTTQALALGLYESLLRGDEDFAAEYPTEIRVLRHYPNRSPRYVRKPVQRARSSDGSIHQVQETRR